MYLDFSAPPVFLTHSHCRLRTFKKGERHENRTPTFSTLLLVISGTMSFLENGEERHISAGEYYIQRAHTRQEGIPITDPPVYYYFHFSGVFSQKPQCASMPIKGLFDMDAGSELCTLVLYKSKSATEEMLHFYNLLLHLQKHNSQNVDAIAWEMSDYISRHIAKIETLDDLCRRFNYSKDHIIRVFRDVYGVTPYKYIKREKIKLSKILLKTTNLTAAQIAERCGYRDLSVFYRAFKGEEKQSPAEYRRDHRK